MQKILRRKKRSQLKERKRLIQIIIGGRNQVKKKCSNKNVSGDISKQAKKFQSKRDKYLDEREATWDKMVEESDHIQAENKLKKKKKGRKNQDMQQYVIETISGHELRKNSKKGCYVVYQVGWVDSNNNGVCVNCKRNSIGYGWRIFGKKKRWALRL